MWDWDVVVKEQCVSCLLILGNCGRNVAHPWRYSPIDEDFAISLFQNKNLFIAGYKKFTADVFFSALLLYQDAVYIFKSHDVIVNDAVYNSGRLFVKISWKAKR